MADSDVLIRPVSALERILSYKETEIGLIDLVDRIIGFFTDRGVAAFAVAVNHRMANLAGKLALVHHMLHNGITRSADFGVAGFTFGQLRACVAVAVRFSRGGMHIRARMAGDAVHAALAKMHITGDFFIVTQILIAHAAAVTGGAGAGHRWCLFHDMPIQKARANALGLADVAISTRDVAVRAVVAKHFIQSWFLRRRAARRKHRLVPIQGHVQALLKSSGLLGMAGGAGCFLTLAGVAYQPGVSLIF